MSDLLLDVSQMREAHARVERTVSADALANDTGVFGVDGPVRLAVAIQKDRQQFRLIGKVQATLELECSRCLVGFEMPVDVAFDVLYLPHSDAKADGEVEIEDDDLSTAYYRDQVIDLGQLVMEQFFMVVPMKPLCRETCRGLCSMCGTNLNTGSCSCTARWEDPRLAVLREIKKDT
ncbi:MAG: DUF177 domain-containing protein [Acidobacteria bacterium]|jgi:uncharacterized protein|nr:DUF177 domain-containing protein [Acidobacteriota bacterium]